MRGQLRQTHRLSVIHPWQQLQLLPPAAAAWRPPPKLLPPAAQTLDRWQPWRAAALCCWCRSSVQGQGSSAPACSQLGNTTFWLGRLCRGGRLRGLRRYRAASGASGGGRLCCFLLPLVLLGDPLLKGALYDRYGHALQQNAIYEISFLVQISTPSIGLCAVWRSAATSCA